MKRGKKKEKETKKSHIRVYRCVQRVELMSGGVTVNVVGNG